jgi:hypothetical protein
MDYFFPDSEFGNSSPPLRTRVFVRCSKARWTISNAACVSSKPVDNRRIKCSIFNFSESFPRKSGSRLPQPAKTLSGYRIMGHG